MRESQLLKEICTASRSNTHQGVCRHVQHGRAPGARQLTFAMRLFLRRPAGDVQFGNADLRNIREGRVFQAHCAAQDNPKPSHRQTPLPSPAPATRSLVVLFLGDRPARCNSGNPTFETYARDGFVQAHCATQGGPEPFHGETPTLFDEALEDLSGSIGPAEIEIICSSVAPF